jgi:NADPH-dependent curcumin reductase CurA
MVIMERRLHIFGFLIWDLEDKYGKEFLDVVPRLVADGAFQHREDSTDGLEKTGDVILAVQKGQNKAKAVVVVAKD